MRGAAGWGAGGDCGEAGVLRLDSLTLPLSGRLEGGDGAAENWWGPVHSSGLFDAHLVNRDSSDEKQCTSNQDKAIFSALFAFWVNF